MLLLVIDSFSKHVWLAPLKDKKKGITSTDAFLKILNESAVKANKKWVDRGNTSHNKPIKS